VGDASLAVIGGVRLLIAEPAGASELPALDLAALEFGVSELEVAELGLLELGWVELGLLELVERDVVSALDLSPVPEPELCCGLADRADDNDRGDDGDAAGEPG